MLASVQYGTAEFDRVLAALEARGESDFTRVEPVVREVLRAVREGGEAAALGFVERFEGRRPARLVRSDVDGLRALERLDPEARAALELAAARITAFHEREREAMFGAKVGPFPGFSSESGGARVGLRVRPLERVGVYAPGGKARYPSSVLMSALPARVAGVREIVMATPLSGDRSDDPVLAAAYLSGVTTLVDAGGAQAIALLAYGGQTFHRVDKIVGPGNAFVACAKRLVYGSVAIDSIAGPSEILVIADRTAKPSFVAADLLSQAEHDEDAYALLVTDDPGLPNEVALEIDRQIARLPRAVIARAALRGHGHAFVVADRAELARVANLLAAEHVSVQVERPREFLTELCHAGAIFVGPSTPEGVGDYLAGPSHVLPTGGCVRFGSPLGVHDFVARSSVIEYSAEALECDAKAVVTLATLEGLEAHAAAVRIRTA